MKSIFSGVSLLLLFAISAPVPAVTVASPAGVLSVNFELRDGAPHYSVERFGEPVINSSRMGLDLADEPSLADDLELLEQRKRSVDETWTQPWGETAEVRNHFNELAVDLGRDGRRLVTVVFRVFDEGLGFRYEVAENDQKDERRVVNERSQFALTGDHNAWWTGAYLPNRYEYLYREGPVSAIWKAVTPLTMKTDQGLYLSFHEAALVDYSEMTLQHVGDHVLQADLIPWSDGSKVRTQGAFVTPWRTLQVTDTAARLIETADIFLNLNEPNKLGDVSWIETGKYVGIWWELHIGKSTWASGEKHGATTGNTKRYIDFAAEHGFNGVLVEGWNVGWDGNWIENAEQFDFTTPYPDYDIDELAAYAKQKGVRLIGHHETSGGIENYERQLEDAMAFMEEHGVRNIKTGYVKENGRIRRHEDGELKLEWQHGQYMVDHMQRVLEVAAEHRIGINTHEPVKDTGLRRTWPNWLTREGQRGQEYNAWSEGNGPEHTTILPFTRMLSGPMDFTPGIFDLGNEEAGSARNIPTTLAKQLALYVVIYSPLQMAADLPENYEAKPDAFQFIKDVPADWEFTRALDGEIGEFVVIARKDRASEDWYLGAVTNDHGRSLTAPLGFLASGATYTAEIYRDGPDAHWDENPEAIVIESATVTSQDTLDLRLAPGGGAAVRFTPAAPRDTEAQNESRTESRRTPPPRDERRIEDEIVYFVMPDRFDNANPDNDTGGLKGDRERHGFDPTHKGFYHGGDLAGLTNRLDYIQGLGVTAIWITPVFVNKPVQGPPNDTSAGYHGYWITDFTDIDPHLGTKEEFGRLVEAAHARGIKIIMDIVVNHTADVIQYRGCAEANEQARIWWSDCGYRSIAEYPWTTRGGPEGEPINPGFEGDAPQHQTEQNFARLTDPNWAYQVFIPEHETDIKVPAWLNEPAHYHNRGNSHWEGESALYGDFSGLDDVFTEHPTVLDGMLEIYKDWISEFSIDGFRVDTAKHVNDAFWQRFNPEILAHARDQGIEDFYLFGESYELEPAALARFTREVEFPAVLDFAFRDAAQRVTTGTAPPAELAAVLAKDDLYRGDGRGALILPTFIGNHDDGRIGHALLETLGDYAEDGELLNRTILGHALMMFSRGVPVIYYGDEQGFTGDGRDQDAREDMFESRVDIYNDNRLIGTDATTAENNFDTDHPLYRAIAGMARVRSSDPALRRGEQKVLKAGDKPGIFAFTRSHAGSRTLVVFNTAGESRDEEIRIDGRKGSWGVEFQRGLEHFATDGRDITVELAPLSFAVLKQDSAGNR